MTDNDNGWTADHLKWMRSWVAQVSVSRIAYAQEARYWFRVYVVLCILVCTITALAGALQVPNLSSNVASRVLQWTGIGFAAIATIIGGINNILQANSISKGCRTAADKLQKLAADIDLVLRANPAERPPHLVYSKSVNDKYDKIVKNAPTLIRGNNVIDKSLPNKTLLDIYVQSAEEMEEIQRQHVEGSAPTPVRSATPPLSSSVSLNKDLARELDHQMHRLEEHIKTTDRESAEELQK